jgi:hypothetical protein
MTSPVLIILGLLLFVPSSTRAAPGTVDTFDTDQTTIERVVGTDPIPSSVSSTASGGDILGGERDIQITIDAGTTTGNRLSSGVGTSLLSVGYEPSIEGTAEIVWDGPDGDATSIDFTGLGGVDLTESGAQDAFIIRINSDDLAASLIIEVFTDSGNSSTATLNLPGSIFSPEDRTVPFSSFTANLGTGADFENVGAIVLSVTSTTPLDLEIDSFGTTSTQPAPTLTPEDRDDDDDDDDVPPPPPPSGGGGGGGPAPTATPAGPTTLPETGEFPPFKDRSPDGWSLILTALLLVGGIGAWFRLRNKNA